MRTNSLDGRSPVDTFSRSCTSYPELDHQEIEPGLSQNPPGTQAGSNHTRPELSTDDHSELSALEAEPVEL